MSCRKGHIGRGAVHALVLVSLVCLIVGCQAEKGYYPSGQAGLQFSCDTVRFDTVFSTVGSTTAWLSVYNPQQQTVLVDTVYLLSHGARGYRISVDALPGNGCRNLEIPAQDSIFVFVELTAPVQHSNEPVELLDYIVFQQGAASQQVTLEASVQDAVVWKGKVLDSNTVMNEDLPYLIYDSLVVDDGVLLEIEKGASLHFHDAAMLYVRGTVHAEGTAEQPVVFRGDRLDKAFTDFKYDSYPGQWYGICLAPESADNVFSHCDIHGAYYGIIADSALDAGACKLRLLDSKVTNMVYSALYNVSSRIKVHGCLLANSGSYTVALIGGATEMIHCTIANYQTLVSREESSPALAVVNFTGDADGKNAIPYPLHQADIINSIVYGSQKNEVGFGLLEEIEHNVYFHHDLLKLEGQLDASIADSVCYNEDPMFLSTGKDYVYDFHIDKTSPAVARADTACTRLCPIDLEGRERISKGQAPVGVFAVEL